MSTHNEKSCDYLLRSALEHHQNGELEQAESLYLQALQINPKQPDALRLLGMLYQHQGHLRRAEYHLLECTRQHPQLPDAHYQLGLVFIDSGKPREAIESLQLALKLRPGFTEAIDALGTLFFESGAKKEAAICFHQVLSKCPERGDLYFRLGMIAQENGSAIEAISHFEKALQIHPELAEAALNLGNLLEAVGRFDDAEQKYRKAIRLQPTNELAQLKLAMLLDGQGRLDEAESVARSALPYVSESAQMHLFLATVLIRQNRVSDAVLSFNQAVQLEPGLRECAKSTLQEILNEGVREWEKVLNRDFRNIEALLGLARIRYTEKHVEEAASLCNQALAFSPADPNVKCTLAFAQLLLGQYEPGWENYEFRFETGQREFRKRTFTQPAWKGDNLSGKCILVYAEQGLGDTIQFIRYVSLLKQMGAKVIVEVQPSLRRLIETMPDVEAVICPGDPQPYFDVQAALLSLPRIFRTTLATIPANVPYLRVPSSVSLPTPKVPRGNRRIGIVWAGNPNLQNDLERSMPLSALLPLWNVKCISIFSFQVGPASKQLKDLPAGMKVWDLREKLNDFSMTAAAIDSMDLIISVDTAVAHLAGALAKPVWLLLPFAPEWRWLLDRSGSPWYPTARLFRQEKPDDWNGVAIRVCQALTAEE